MLHACLITCCIPCNKYQVYLSHSTSQTVNSENCRERLENLRTQFLVRLGNITLYMAVVNHIESNSHEFFSFLWTATDAFGWRTSTLSDSYRELLPVLHLQIRSTQKLLESNRVQLLLVREILLVSTRVQVLLLFKKLIS